MRGQLTQSRRTLGALPVAIEGDYRRQTKLLPEFAKVFGFRRFVSVHFDLENRRQKGLILEGAKQLRPLSQRTGEPLLFSRVVQEPPGFWVREEPGAVQE